MSTVLCSPAKDQHSGFLKLAPVVERRARFAFRDRNPEAKEEAVAEATAAAFQSYVALKGRGINAARRFPGAMADFAILHVLSGRRVGGHESSKCVMSRKAQRKHGFLVFRFSRLKLDKALERRPMVGEAEDVVEAQINMKTPVPDQAAFRIDFPAFLRKLTHRDRRLARFLSLGHSGKEAAAKFKLSPGRVTQLRQQWQREWLVFHGEANHSECVPA